MHLEQQLSVAMYERWMTNGSTHNKKFLSLYSLQYYSLRNESLLYSHRLYFLRADNMYLLIISFYSEQPREILKRCDE